MSSGGCAGKCSRDLVENVLEICRLEGHDIRWTDCNIIPETTGELIQSVDLINQLVLTLRYLEELLQLTHVPTFTLQVVHPSFAI